MSVAAAAGIILAGSAIAALTKHAVRVARRNRQTVEKGA